MTLNVKSASWLSIFALVGILLIVSFQNCSGQIEFIKKVSASGGQDGDNGDNGTNGDDGDNGTNAGDLEFSMDLVDETGYPMVTETVAHVVAKMVPDSTSTEGYYTEWIIPEDVPVDGDGEDFNLYFYPQVPGEMIITAILRRSADHSEVMRVTEPFTVISSSDDCIFCDGFEDD